MKRYVKASLTSGYVGIWWIYDKQVIADLVPLDNGYNDGSFIHYSDHKNHLTEWHEMMQHADLECLIADGYKSVERGRVVYNIRTMCYEIVCSEAVAKDIAQIKLLVDAFELNNCRYDIVVDSHYHIAKLTGNPALDAFEYGI